MPRDETLARILEAGIVAVVRAESSEKLVPVVRALARGGVSAIEITFTVPDALDVIRGVKRDLGHDIILGAGTVLDPETARAALLAGADFVVSPTLNVETIRLVRRYGAVMMPGAFSPTEVLTAWESGADVVKVFPADVGGPAYLKALRGPLPQIRLMPTGGVDLGTAEDFLNAGAAASASAPPSSIPSPSPPETSPTSSPSPNNTPPSSAASTRRPRTELLDPKNPYDPTNSTLRFKRTRPQGR